MVRWTVRVKGGPTGSKGNASVAVGHKVYCFGGLLVRETNTNHKDHLDVHVFNTVSLRWVKLTPGTTNRGERSLATFPSRRHRHTVALIDDIIYIWGGYRYSTKEYCNVLYALDVDTHGWFKPNVSGTVPGPRYNHSACVLGKVMCIYGGFNQLTRYTNDIYKLDTTTMLWSVINTRGTPAPVLDLQSATVTGTKMLVFGGYNYNHDYSNISVFDTETSCWLSAHSAQLLPEGRWGHSAFAHNGELYIFGGHNLCQNFNDLWKYNPESFRWKKVEPKGTGPCWMTRMCCCMVGHCVVLFGEDTPDELYMLDLSPSLKTLGKLAVIQYGLERSGLPHDIRWELAAMTANADRKGELTYKLL